MLVPDRMASDSVLFPVEGKRVALLIPIPMAGKAYVNVMSADTALKLSESKTLPPAIVTDLRTAAASTQVSSSTEVDFWETKSLKEKDFLRWVDEQLGTFVPGTQLPLDVMNFLAGKG